jgi:exonuclease SbcD
MRILHTADWHLGQLFHGYDRIYEQTCFLNWLLELLIKERIDVLLLAGDVFDTPNPPVLSQNQYYAFLAQAKERVPHLQIIIIAGNHDSAGRLEAPSPLLETRQITVVGTVKRDPSGDVDLESFLVPLKNQDGSIAAWCVAVPFLRPGDVPKCPDAADPFLAGIAKIYEGTTALAFSRITPGQAVLAMGHCHLHQGMVSEQSERRLVIGGAEALSSDIFDGKLAYVALGHLHLPQSFGPVKTIRYAGSPLPLAFSEIDYPHQVIVFNLEAGTVSGIESIRIPRFVELLRIPKSPKPLAQVLEELQSFDFQRFTTETSPYLEVQVEVQGPEPGLRAKIEEVLEGKPVKLVPLVLSYPAASTDTCSVKLTLEELHRLHPEEIFRRIYKKQYAIEPPDVLLKALGELLVGTGEEVCL